MDVPRWLQYAGAAAVLALSAGIAVMFWGKVNELSGGGLLCGLMMLALVYLDRPGPPSSAWLDVPGQG